MPRKRYSRDARIAPRGGPDPRSLPQFRREVVALLAVGHRIPTSTGLRLIKKWDTYVRRRWAQGKPPCDVSDHIFKFEGHKRLSHDRKRPRRRTARDVGDVYESKRGDRWEVVSEDERKVFVKRSGHRQAGVLPWSKQTLKAMKEVGKAKKNESSEGIFKSIFGGHPVAPDVDHAKTIKYRRAMWGRKMPRTEARVEKARRRWRRRSAGYSTKMKLTRKQRRIFHQKLLILLDEGYDKTKAVALAHNYVKRYVKTSGDTDRRRRRRRDTVRKRRRRSRVAPATWMNRATADTAPGRHRAPLKGRRLTRKAKFKLKYVELLQQGYSEQEAFAIAAKYARSS